MASHDIDRRRFLRAATVLAVGGAVAPSARAAARRPGELSFHHIYTGEKLSVAFADTQGYLEDGLSEVDRFLRDFRTAEVHHIDPGVLDILNAARLALKPDGVFEVISGYRSPKTNAMLRSQGRGVAKRSLHTQGRAVDVRLSGVPTATFREFCLKLKRGGVGYYPKSDFVHVDTGRVRFW